ncbi:hypothetical protein RRF57_013126 [Xylaria bambusicola]|uniref:Uncharacterized protein n=1 Tax=Xylaria bambusicola TaxID=326684 RepID=A0AAN7V6A2_9PEZI
MEPDSSEPPRELDDLSPPSVVDFGAERASPVSRSSTPQERPKVRFNSKVDLPALAAEPAAETSGEQRRPASSKPQVLRPALSRNPSSYNSAASDIGDASLSAQKRASAAAAAERARAVALDTWLLSNSPDSPDSRRWSIESEAMTDASYSEVPIANSYASPQVQDYASLNDHGGQLDVEAQGLLKAHTRNLGSVLRNVSGMVLNSYFLEVNDYKQLLPSITYK